MLTKSLETLTDADLDAERAYWSAEIASRSRWGDDIDHARDARDAVEREQRRRRIQAARVGDLHVRPIVVDDPDVRPAVHSAPVIIGSAKARNERRPTRFGLIAATGVILACLAFSAALAGQRLLEIESRFAAMERV
ncbi:hypothetical protein RHAB21_02546 [Pseudorhizobium halotolerans]|uniref:Uncharacterized protein n=1 Tax=Pseudorhizobium halotolerans TaxID=1233081 RepID=A0ABM8PLK2_9HYPH|nr:hypothetical protein [Pseudorhizobium halotolerans]CAD7036603.1 hypothetical protein RHAB21_02546 [Pseudorhizobium halotolerans]